VPRFNGKSIFRVSPAEGGGNTRKCLLLTSNVIVL